MALADEPPPMTDWQDRIVGARMAVDRSFADRVTEAGFSRQQWGLVMTAVEFEIEHADDPERAELVADASKLVHVMPEIESVDRQAAAVAGAEPGGGSGGGLFGSIKGLLGLGGDDGVDEELRRSAAALAEEYAAELQAHLESEGRWEEIRTTAAG